tara:strand:+ start:580 stop:765 length:186 start_codon:yes stop_codon:yes gene_type:complete
MKIDEIARREMKTRTYTRSGLRKRWWMQEHDGAKAWQIILAFLLTPAIVYVLYVIVFIRLL